MNKTVVKEKCINFAKIQSPKIRPYMNDEITIYCPDCRGRFEMDSSLLIEEDVTECELCGAGILVASVDPIRLKIYSEEDDF